LDEESIIQELRFKAVRSSGAGGQNVNKVSSKVELIFDLETSGALSEKEKIRLYKKLDNRLTKDNILLLQCDTNRSQHKNKEAVITRFLELLKEALKVPKKRRKTRPSRTAIEKRLKAKSKRASKKENRKKPDVE
jgi:ribosome-associated protein